MLETAHWSRSYCRLGELYGVVVDIYEDVVSLTGNQLKSRLIKFQSPNSEIGLDSCARCMFSASYSNGYYGRYHAATIFRLYVFLGRPPNKNGARITVLIRPKELHRGILLTLEDSRCADDGGRPSCITSQQGIVGQYIPFGMYTPRARHQNLADSVHDVTMLQLLPSHQAGPSAALTLLAADVQ